MGFAGSVTALLDIYSRCLALLKAFSSRSEAGDQTVDQQSLLRRSIKSDRAKVRRVYSSRLSETGSRLEKGDARARSALRRVLKRLTDAIAKLLGLAKSPDAVLDCNSLMSLSNSSRVDAIRAIDRLSYRLGGSSSRSSLASSKTKTTNRMTPSTKKGDHSSASSPGGRGKGSQTNSLRRPTEMPRDSGRSKTLSKTRPKDEVRRTHSSERGAGAGAYSRQDSAHRREGSASSNGLMQHRVSVISYSSASTKLGEIPERKWRSRQDFETRSGEYNVRPAYPPKLCKIPETTKRKKFLGIF